MGRDAIPRPGIDAARLGADNPAQAAHGLLAEHGWGHLLVLEGSTGVTIYSREGEDAHVDCTLTELKQMIGLIDAAAVAITAAVALDWTYKPPLSCQRRFRMHPRRGPD